MNLFIYKLKSSLQFAYVKIALSLVGMFLPIIIGMHPEIRKELSVFC